MPPLHLSSSSVAANATFFARRSPTKNASSLLNLVVLVAFFLFFAMTATLILATQRPSSFFHSKCAEGRSLLPLGVLLPDSYMKKIEPAIVLALKHIQSRADLLPGFCLKLVYKDTKCSTSVGMRSLFDLLSTVGNNDKAQRSSKKPTTASEGKPVALFGDICLSVNEPVSMACKYWKFGWSRIGTVKQSDDSSLALSHERLTTRLENAYDVRVVHTASLSSEQLSSSQLDAELEEFVKKDVHIIIGDFRPNFGVDVLCAAFFKGLFGKEFLWILPGYHNTNWLENAEQLSNCSREQLAQVLEGHFAIEFAATRSFLWTEVLASGKSAEQVQQELRILCSRMGRVSCSVVHSSYAYDGIWTLALALNNTLKAFKSPSLDDRNFTNHLLATVRDTSFQGLTGRVRFDSNGERSGLVNILHWLNGSYSPVGVYDGTTDLFYLRKTLTNYWKPPLDATIVVKERQYISVYLLSTMTSLSAVGICISLVLLLTNIKYRNHKFIKMSSPNMNNVIIAGALFTYTSVFLLGIDTRLVKPDIFELLCYAKTWVLCMGFTLAFGSMFAKTWRVHSIFTNIRRDKKAIKDLKLYGIVGGLLLADFFCLVAWAIISPFKFSIVELEKTHHQNALIVPELERCASDHALVFQVIFYVIKGMLMLFGCFLAWETRAVNVPALNDSKYIGISVYVVVVMCITGLSMAFILQDRLNEAFALISMFIIFCTTLILGLVFAPKVVEIIRTPKGGPELQRYRYRKAGSMMKSIMEKGGSVLSGPAGNSTYRGPQQENHSSHQTSVMMPEDLSKRIAHLEMENNQLHQHLTVKSSELWNLLERVRIHEEAMAAAELAAFAINKTNSGKRDKQQAAATKTLNPSNCSGGGREASRRRSGTCGSESNAGGSSSQQQSQPIKRGGDRRQSAIAGLFLSVTSHSRQQLGRLRVQVRSQQRRLSGLS